ncbi:hypothetical protein C8Q73DRAFT_833912 [Cubamyces lactineus]|nr:hypothetical protein C8Q73DRAFT_833912 [Cubamyces lactineus]
MIMSFLERVGTHQFQEPTPMWGYLPQLNQWAGTALQWEIMRDGGEDHIPLFKAIPIYHGERLEVFAAHGVSKKAAKENAASRMARSGHCSHLVRPKLPLSLVVPLFNIAT